MPPAPDLSGAATVPLLLIDNTLRCVPFSLTIYTWAPGLLSVSSDSRKAYGPGIWYDVRNDSPGFARCLSES